MGKKKYADGIERLFNKSPVVNFDSLQRIIGNKSYAKLSLNNLIKKGSVMRLSKGCYTSHNDVSLAVFCFKPAYLGLESALSLHGLWDQETIPIIVTSKKVRQGKRIIDGKNFFIRRIKTNFVFGFSHHKEGDFYIPYSDIEKTFIDMVVFRKKISPEVLLKFRKKVNRKILRDYLKSYPKNIKNRVLKKLEIS